MAARSSNGPPAQFVRDYENEMGRVVVIHRYKMVALFDI